MSGAVLKSLVVFVLGLQALVLVQSTCTGYPPDTDVTNNSTFDFVVIGAGSAGSVVARRLAEHSNWSVLLLEAGRDPLPVSDVPMRFLELGGTEMNWAFKTEPQERGCLGMNNRQCAYPQGKGLGGGSSINAMFYVRGNRDDFDEWERLGNPGWGYDSVLEFFKKSENMTDPDLASSEFHSQGGLQGVSRFKTPARFTQLREDIVAGVKENGLQVKNDANGAEQIGFSPVHATVLNGVRQNTGRAFLGCGQLSNLVVSKNSRVGRVLVKDGQAVGVEFTKQGKTIQVNVKREVVLSAGALNSPHILLLSGVGPRDHLEEMDIDVVHELPGVGQNLQDHFMTGSAFYTLKQDQKCLDVETAMAEYRDSQTGEFANNGGVGMFSAFLGREGGSTLSDVQFIFLAGCKNESFIPEKFLLGYNARNDIADLLGAKVKGKSFLYFSPLSMESYSRGTITLRSTNPEDDPVIDPKVFSDDRDVKTVLRGMRAAQRILNSTAMRKYEATFADYDAPDCKGLEADSDERLECFIRLTPLSNAHYAGTCAMGPSSEESAVVDARLRVHGVRGLRVVDGSVMPLVTSGNTNAPIIMIGEKGAAMIIEDWASVVMS